MMTGILSSRWIHIFLLLGLLSGAVLVRINDYEWIKALRYLAFDTYNKIDPREPTGEVVLADIDEESLRRLGQWPWPRSVLARLVARRDCDRPRWPRTAGSLVSDDPNDEPR